MKALVAYFSASDRKVTKGVATLLAETIGADIFEIEPKVPYTFADLNWRDSSSRSSIEMNDKSCRPEMAAAAPDVTDYGVIFVGFPVWWYREPSIIDTFIESCDMEGKIIVPFATSGMSGIGDSWKTIQDVAPGARVVPGKRFDRRVSSSELKDWAEEWV